MKVFTLVMFQGAWLWKHAMSRHVASIGSFVSLISWLEMWREMQQIGKLEAGLMASWSSSSSQSKSINRSIDRSINQSINQSINHHISLALTIRSNSFHHRNRCSTFVHYTIPPPKKKNKLAQGDTPLSWNCRRWRGIHGWKLIGSNEVWFRCKSTAQSKPKL